MRLNIHDIGHGGVGIGRHDGRVVFVRGALPGEVVDAEVTAEKSKFLNAVVTEVIEPSEYRVDHPWPDGAAGWTGAADFGHVSIKGQLALKTAVVRQNIRRIGGEDLAHELDQVNERGGVSVRGVDSGDGWGTRTRVEVTKMDTGVGMYREKSNDLVPITEMPLAVPDLAELDVWGSAWDDIVDPGTRLKIVAPASGENVVVADDRVWSAPAVNADQYVWERATTNDKIYDYRLSAGGFWQVHERAPSTLLRAVLDGANAAPGEHVAELFSGAGLFTLPLALTVGESGTVSAFDGSKQAVGDARYNLRDTPWARVDVRRIDAAITPHIDAADVVVADPPRSGLGQTTSAAIAKLPARRIVLVSCDPAAMARDVAQLVTNGRKVISVDAIDIFPNTHHVEIVTVLD